MIYSASLKELHSDKIHGYRRIITKDQLNKIVADTSAFNTVIIHADFAEEYFTPTGLSKFIENVKKINKNLLIQLDESTLVKTPESFMQMLYDCYNLEEIIQLAVGYEKEFFDLLRYLIESRDAKDTELLSASTTVSRLQLTIDAKDREINELKHQLNIERQNKLNIGAALSALIGRINYQYDAGVDKTKLFFTDVNEFDKVIYIKEVTRVQYVDSFVYYLKEILKILYGCPTRLVVVESYYGTGKLDLYPDLKPHYALSERDVLSGDILMLGVQPVLLNDIMHNASRINFLIILDRGGYKVPHVIGDNVEYFYTASDINDVPQNIPIDRIISYDNDSLYIPLIKDFDRLDSTAKMTRYSSMDIIKAVVRLVGK